MTTTATDKGVPFLAVYIGMRRLRGGKDGHVWCVMGSSADSSHIDDTDDTLRRIWVKPIQSGATPGSVWELRRPADDASSVLVNAGRWVRTFANEAKVAEWQSLHAAARARKAADSKKKAALRKRWDLDALEPFTRAYDRADAPTRTLLLADVIRTITGGLAVLMTLTASGCAPKGSGPGPGAPPAVAFVGTLTAREQERCREAWTFYLARFERDERPLRPWRSLTFVAGDEVSPGHGGEVRPGRHVVIATEGEETCASSYHEMAHLLLMDEGGDGDPGHTDPRWSGWSARQQRAVFDLIDDRIARNGDSAR